MWDKPGRLNWFWQFLNERLPSFNPKDLHGFTVYVKEGLLVARDLSLENSVDSHFYFRLALLHKVSYFFFLYWLPSSCFCIIFCSISCNIDEVLSINPSAVFVLGDFDVHHKDWLTYSSGTDTSSELCYNFSISNDLTKMVNFPTCILACDSHSPALFDLFFSSDVSICSTMAFPPLGNSDHVVFSVCIDYSWHLWSNGLVVNAVDSQSRSTVFKTIGWLQDWLSLSSFWGW